MNREEVSNHIKDIIKEKNLFEGAPKFIVDALADTMADLKEAIDSEKQANENNGVKKGHIVVKRLTISKENEEKKEALFRKIHTLLCDMSEHADHTEENEKKKLHPYVNIDTPIAISHIEKDHECSNAECFYVETIVNAIKENMFDLAYHLLSCAYGHVRGTVYEILCLLIDKKEGNVPALILLCKVLFERMNRSSHEN